MKAIVAIRPGGTEVMEMVDLPEPVAGPGQVVVEVAAAGVNFSDIGVRRGIIGHDIQFPHTLGVEGAGRVIEIGGGTCDFVIGQRVAWAYGPGSYAERVAISADALVPVPDEIDDQHAAAIMMQGLTASHFATDFYPIQPGDIALVHAAAGGLGQLLTRIIKLRGGRSSDASPRPPRSMPHVPPVRTMSLSMMEAISPTKSSVSLEERAFMSFMMDRVQRLLRARSQRCVDPEHFVGTVRFWVVQRRSI